MRAVLSLTQSYEGSQAPPREVTNEFTATVIDKDGTTLIPLSSIDPGPLTAMMDPEFQIDARVQDLKIIVNKRTEIAASVVRRDPDLDLALIRPTTPPEDPLTFIDIRDNAEAQLLEQVFVLTRFDSIADFEVGAMTGEIQAVVKRPRTYYVPSSNLIEAEDGTPVFNAEGRLIGFIAVRVAPATGNSSGDIIYTVLPAADAIDLLDMDPED